MVRFFLFMLILISVSQRGQSWGWFSSSSNEANYERHGNTYVGDNSVAEFSMEGLNDATGLRRIENAKRKMVGSNSCWQNAYSYLFAGCSEIINIEEKRSRFAWHLTDCFQKDSGKPAFPNCDTNAPMVNCLKRLNDDERKFYLEFLLETNSICYQLQTHAFKQETERLVNDLKSSAEYAEEKLETIEQKSDYLLQGSVQIRDSLNNVDIRVQGVAETAKHVGEHLEILSKYSDAVYKQAKELAASQLELRDGQEKMSEKLEEGITTLHDAYENLGEEVNNLKNEAIEIEKEINKVGETMSSKMMNLQEKADDIGNLTGSSLAKQQQLLDGQSTALEGLQFLTKFQTDALQESRSTLQSLAEYSKKQQEELLKKQEQLQQVHDHLVESSKSILEAQEAFESKQASMFIALEKLFALHNAMLLESRIFKTVFIYFVATFAIYLFTSTKQTYNIRSRLYLGLVVAMLTEIAVMRYTSNGVEQQVWIITLVRSLLATLAAAQFLYAIFTYRDYEVLNHNILLDLVDKVGIMQSERNKELQWEEEDDDDVDWSRWVDLDLPEDEGSLIDPDYMIQDHVEDDYAITSSISRKYDLRRRY
ncbi:hypothetical protein ACFE04_006080 [Oxalis oulophora]